MLIPLMAEAAGSLLLIAILFVISAGLLVLLLGERRKNHHDPLFVTNQIESLLRYMPEGYIGLDNHGIIKEVNDTYLSMTGYKRRDVLGKALEYFIPMEGKETIAFQLKTIETLNSQLMETAHRCKNNTILPLEVSITSTGFSNPAFMCFYRDISQRKKDELSRKHSTDLLRYVIEHTRSAVAIHDKNLRYLYVSQKYLDEYGLKDASSIIGRHHYDVLPDLPQKWRDVHQRALAGEVISAEDDPYVREDGSVEYTRWECRPWYTEQGTIGGIIIYTEMITKQKEFEHELKKTKDYLETVLTHANAPIVVWDTSLTITLANQAFSSLFGLSVEQMIGHRLVEFEQYIPLQHRDALYLQLGTRKAIDAAEIEMAQSDGSNRTLLWNVSPMFNPDTGDLVAIIAQGQDISERKKIEQEHAGQLEELRRWYAVMTNREDRIIALKREVNALLKYEGKAIRYASVEDETHA